MTTPDTLDGVPDAETFRLNGDVMRFALRAANMTNADLAHKIGVHEATVSRILRGAYTSALVCRHVMDVFPRLRMDEILDVGDLSAKLPRGAKNTEGE